MSAEEVKKTEELNEETTETVSEEETAENIDQQQSKDKNETGNKENPQEQGHLNTQEEPDPEQGAEVHTDPENNEETPQIDEKEAIIAQLEQELASTKDSLLRKAAELENVRKRVQRERMALYEEARVAALPKTFCLFLKIFNG